MILNILVSLAVGAVIALIVLGPFALAMWIARVMNRHEEEEGWPT